MPDVHEQLRAAAADPTRDVPLAQIEHRLRSRRRTRRGGVLACGALVVGVLAGGVTLAATDDGPTPSVETAGPSDPESTGVSVELPPGWFTIDADPQADPRLDVLIPAPLISAGTAPIVSSNWCPTDLRASTEDAFVSVVESVPSPSTRPEGAQTGSRPADFATAPAYTVGSCTERSGSGTESRSYHYAFADHDRFFSATVVLGSAASPERRAEAYGILNSFRVEGAQPTPTVAPVDTTALPSSTTVPPSTVPVSDDERAVRAVFVGWLEEDGQPDARYIEDYESIRDVMKRAVTENLDRGRFSGRVDAVLEITNRRAVVVYTILIDGAPVISRQGEAVKVGDKWRVSRGTVCDAIADAGAICPRRR